MAKRLQLPKQIPIQISDSRLNKALAEQFETQPDNFTRTQIFVRSMLRHVGTVLHADPSDFQERKNLAREILDTWNQHAFAFDRGEGDEARLATKLLMYYLDQLKFAIKGPTGQASRITVPNWKKTLAPAFYWVLYSNEDKKRSFARIPKNTTLQLTHMPFIPQHPTLRSLYDRYLQEYKNVCAQDQ